jgi:hypothetical protein
MSNAENRSEAHIDRVCGTPIAIPLDLANTRPVIHPDWRSAWFGEVRVVVYGEYLPAERDARRDFDVQAVMVGGVDIISGLTNAQIESLAEQAAWGTK